MAYIFLLLLTKQKERFVLKWRHIYTTDYILCSSVLLNAHIIVSICTFRLQKYKIKASYMVMNMLQTNTLVIP